MQQRPQNKGKSIDIFDINDDGFLIYNVPDLAAPGDQGSSPELTLEAETLFDSEVPTASTSLSSSTCVSTLGTPSATPPHSSPPYISRPMGSARYLKRARENLTEPEVARLDKQASSRAFNRRKRTLFQKVGDLATAYPDVEACLVIKKRSGVTHQVFIGGTPDLENSLLECHPVVPPTSSVQKVDLHPVFSGALKTHHKVVMASLLKTNTVQYGNSGSLSFLCGLNDTTVVQDLTPEKCSFDKKGKGKGKGKQ